ncbi:HYR domain-containing protein [Tenacibaculum agarivorans]|uniref:HYR domain-containing protein n=1 Tax=Tenacibaculum agarivorans TaxID=1908389 RepID=UPI00094BA19F|nr:HYR domain-containing protein [Tenacibaculum agarivorans]
MKKFYILVLQCFVGIAISHAQYTSILDPAFEATLGFLGYDDISGDGQVPTANIINVTELVLNNTAISSLAGIEDFTGLISLEVSDNNISSIDVSKHTLLENLKIDNCNSLKIIVLGENNKLIDLSITGTLIEYLDLSSFEDLTEINVSNNNLSYLNVQTGTSEFINNFDAKNNANLSCILVDDATYSTNRWTDDIDATSSFSDTYCRYTAIPDANFEAELSDFDDIPNDGQVPTALIVDVTGLTINNKNINDLTGIEDFTALQTLIADRNNLKALDVSHNHSLRTLRVFRNDLETLVLGDIGLEILLAFENQLTELDFSQNTALRVVNIRDNQLSNLNIKNGNNTEVTGFFTTGNAGLTCITVDDAAYAQANFTSVDPQVTFNDVNCVEYTSIPDANFEAALGNLGYDDITGDGQVPTALIEVVTELEIGSQGISDLTGIEGFKALYDLRAENNNLTHLDFSNNPLLEELYLRNNPIATLDITGNPLLKSLLINTGTLSSIDVSNNSNLRYFEIENTNIELVNLSNSPDLQVVYVANNNLSSLNIKNGFNSNIEQSFFRTTGNPNLTCIAVDDTAYSTAHWANIDAQTTFTDEYCRYTQIPDAAFETALENLGLDDISGDGQVPTTLIETVTSLDASARGISNLTGIEAFAALQVLDVNDNRIDALDLSGNVQLTHLNASVNALDNLNIQGCKQLIELNASTNNLTELYLDTNTSLQVLEISNNPIVELNLSFTTDLITLNMKDCHDILELNLSANKALQNVNIENATSLQALSIKNGTNEIIQNFSTIGSANLFCVAVDDVGYSMPKWTNIDVLTEFTSGYCRYTEIPDAAFEAALGNLGYDDVPGTKQVPTALIENITMLNIDSKNIADLTGIEDFIALQELSARSNPFTEIALSNNANITSLDLFDVNLKSLDVKALIHLQNLSLSNNSISTIDLSENKLLEHVAIQNCVLFNEIDLFHNEALQELSIWDCALGMIDIKNNMKLTSLVISQNNLISIDFEMNTLLEEIFINENPIKSVDLSKASNLTAFSAKDCDLSNLNIKNDNNTDIVFFETRGNPNLNCILVDDAANSTTNWTNIDPHTSFSTTDCEPPVLTCANDITVDNEAGLCGATIIIPQPEISDNYSVVAVTSPITRYRFSGFNKALKDTPTIVSNATMLNSDVSLEITMRGAHGKRGNYFFLKGPDDSTILRNDNLGNCTENIRTVTVSQSVWNNWVTTYGSDLTFTLVNNFGIKRGNCNNSYFSLKAYSAQGGLRVTNDYNNSNDASGFYPNGTTVVNWTATDDAGNTTTCSQTIIVHDKEGPQVVSCPSDITTNTCDATVIYDIPKAVDNCVTDLRHIGSFNNKNYYVYDTLTTAAEAFDIAESYNGFVVTVDSQELNDWLRNTINAIEESNIFIGYTDRAEERVFKWHSGSTSDYNNWTGSEPNDFQGAEDYTIMKSNGDWNDVGDTFSAKVVIEIADEFAMAQVAGLPSGSEFPVGTTTNIFETSDAAGNITTCSFDVTVEACSNLTLSIKTYLQGAAVNPNVGEETLMRDDLRIASLIPTTSPYQDDLSCDTSVFDVTGEDAIVDWVWVELRDKDNPTTTSYARSALLQRDGDVVDVDGISPLSFSTADDTYYIAIQHRNHLGIRSSNPITFSPTENNSIDFTNNFSTIEGGSNAIANLGNSKYALIAGDFDENRQVQNIDTNAIIQLLGVSGYNKADVNMNGQVQNSDINSILNTNIGKGEQF